MTAATQVTVFSSGPSLLWVLLRNKSGKIEVSYNNDYPLSFKTDCVLTMLDCFGRFLKQRQGVEI